MYYLYYKFIYNLKIIKNNFTSAMKIKLLIVKY